jgi:menaquinone-dependent protoporphyrinogen oxidase
VEVVWMSRVLVVHAAPNNDIRQIAEAIATVATAAGGTARVAGSDSVGRPLCGWDLVVLGGPLRHGRWHREAHRFLERHRDDLVTVPVAVFGLASIGSEDAWARNRAGLDRALQRHRWFVPVSVTLFDAASPRGAAAVPTGSRDWTHVGDWARKLTALVDRD